MEITPYYTYEPPLELALDLNIILDIDTLDFSDYSYIYGQLNHIILDFEEVTGFLERFKYLKKIKIDRNISQSYDDILESYNITTSLNNKFSIKKNIRKFIPRKLF